MKYRLLALLPALLLASCAEVRVTHTDIATGASGPKAIYIRPFDVSECDFRGRHHSAGEAPIRKSLAPVTFAGILKEEMEKMAPALVLKDGDVPHTGWLIEGSLDVVDSGHPGERAIPGNLFGYGASHVLIHVRVIDLDATSVSTDAKADKTGVSMEAQRSRHGVVIYEFDVAGGSRLTGKFGSVTAPGLGYAPPFDFRNAAERIYEALSTDPHRYGARSSLTIQ